MPSHYAVMSLREMGRDAIMRKICAVILEEIYFSSDDGWETFGSPIMSPRLQMVRDILCSTLGAPVLEEILNIMLFKDDAVDVSVRYLALQLLLVKGVTWLAVGHFPESYYTLVLEVIAESAADLERLDLKGLWVRQNDKLALCKALRRLHKIKHLILRYVCDDELLAIIGKHCPKLQKLDIAGSQSITESGILGFIANPSCTSLGFQSDICASLQILDFGGPGAQQLSANIGAKILKGLPKIRSLGSYEKTGHSIEILFKEDPNVQLDLRYIHDLKTNSERLSMIVKTCPRLQAVYLDCPGATAVQHLDMLRSMTELKLHKVKCNDLKILLEKCGTKLKSLILISVWGQLDLLTFGTLVPELVKLELHSVSLICSDSSHDYAFKKLRDLNVYHTQLTTTSVKLIMNQCIHVETLSLGNCAQLSDAALISSLMDHSLQNVRSIWFGLAEELTMRTVEALIEHCKELTNLGNLATWKIHPDDIALLRVKLLLTNFDLTLHEFGPEEVEGDFLIIDAE